MICSNISYNPESSLLSISNMIGGPLYGWVTPTSIIAKFGPVGAVGSPLVLHR